MESHGSLPAKESQVSVPEGYEVVCVPGGQKYLVPSQFVPDVKLKLAMEETREKMQVQATQSEVCISVTSRTSLPTGLRINVCTFAAPHLFGSRVSEIGRRFGGGYDRSGKLVSVIIFF